MLFRGYEDIVEMYGRVNSRGLKDRVTEILHLHRQPRPHCQLVGYVNRRCGFIQKINPTDITMDFKMNSKRKEVYGNRTNLFGF